MTATCKAHMAEHSMGRIVLHVWAWLRDGHLVFHARGILREFWRRKACLDSFDIGSPYQPEGEK